MDYLGYIFASLLPASLCKLHSCSISWMPSFVPLLSTSARTWRCPHGGHTEWLYPQCRRRRHTACLAGRGTLHTSGCILGGYPVMEIKTGVHLYSQGRGVDGFETGQAGLRVTYNLSSNVSWGRALVLMSFSKTTLGKPFAPSPLSLWLENDLLSQMPAAHPTVPLRSIWKCPWVFSVISQTGSAMAFSQQGLGI